MVEGKNDELSTTELSGGARIHYIFQSIFVKSLEVCKFTLCAMQSISGQTYFYFCCYFFLGSLLVQFNMLYLVFTNLIMVDLINMKC